MLLSGGAKTLFLDDRLQSKKLTTNSSNFTVRLLFPGGAHMDEKKKDMNKPQNPAKTPTKNPAKNK